MPTRTTTIRRQQCLDHRVPVGRGRIPHGMTRIAKPAMNLPELYWRRRDLAYPASTRRPGPRPSRRTQPDATHPKATISSVCPPRSRFATRNPGGEPKRFPDLDGAMERQLRIGQAKATPEHLNAIIGLIDEATEWLPAKGTKQWSKPWPDREARDARVWHGLELGATWIVWEVVCGIAVLAATVTVTGKPNPMVWSPRDFNLGVRAVYAHRLITARRYKGWDLGAELLDWTGRRGRHNYGARSIRIDVWTNNEALHGYYVKRGFEKRGTCRDVTYPSGVLLREADLEDPLRDEPAIHRVRRGACRFLCRRTGGSPVRPARADCRRPDPLDPGPRADLYGIGVISEIPLDVEEPAVAGLLAASA